MLSLKEKEKIKNKLVFMRTSNSSFFYTKINGKGDYYEKNILW